MKLMTDDELTKISWLQRSTIEVLRAIERIATQRALAEVRGALAERAAAFADDPTVCGTIEGCANIVRAMAKEVGG